MSPKQIYFYWGNQSMSFLRYMTLKSFSHFNPSWEINLVQNRFSADNRWITPEEQDNIKYHGRDYRDLLQEINNLKFVDLDTVFPRSYTKMSNVHIKDMLNWYLLSTKSCVVADMDITFCKSIEEGEGIDWNANVNVACYDFYRNYIPVSFMVSKVTEDGTNSFYNQVYENSINRYSPECYESCGFSCIGYGDIKQIQDNFPDLIVNKMDYMTVFPFVYPDPSPVGEYIWNNDNSHLFNKNTIGVHWYGGQPQSQANNGLITIDNYKDHNNTITSIIKTIL